MDTDWDQREREMADTWGHLDDTYRVSGQALRTVALIVGVLALLVLALPVGLTMPV